MWQIHVFLGWVKVSPEMLWTVFLRKHGFVKKTCVLFCQFKFVYFLETIYECSILWINMMVRISLVVNSVLFWIWGYARETWLDLISKTWVGNIRFSTSLMCTKNNWYLIITAQRIDILDLNLMMNKLSTNCGLSE